MSGDRLAGDRRGGRGRRHAWELDSDNAGSVVADETGAAEEGVGASKGERRRAKTKVEQDGKAC